MQLHVDRSEVFSRSFPLRDLTQELGKEQGGKYSPHDGQNNFDRTPGAFALNLTRSSIDEEAIQRAPIFMRTYPHGQQDVFEGYVITGDFG
jgi:hypothetical protein